MRDFLRASGFEKLLYIDLNTNERSVSQTIPYLDLWTRAASPHHFPRSSQEQLTKSHYCPYLKVLPSSPGDRHQTRRIAYCISRYTRTAPSYSRRRLVVRNKHTTCHPLQVPSAHPPTLRSICGCWLRGTPASQPPARGGMREGGVISNLQQPRVHAYLCTV